MKLLTSKQEITEKFESCCKRYTKLSAATAWVGSPSQLIPFGALDHLNNISMVIGFSFDQSHPDGIKDLLSRSENIRMINDEEGVFHPKLYIFESRHEACVLVGSVNFTFSGFARNDEVVACYVYKNKSEDKFKSIKRYFNKLYRSERAFFPDASWLQEYDRRFRVKVRTPNGGPPPLVKTDEYPDNAWLTVATWDVFCNEVKKAFEDKEARRGYENVILRAKNELQPPWRLSYLDDLEIRKVIGGYGEYGWFGNTYSNGRFAGLLRSAPNATRKEFLHLVNQLSVTKEVSYKRMARKLEGLERFGFKMNCWGRLLLLNRPDYYPTVCNLALRRNLARAVGLNYRNLDSATGYVELIQKLHNAPWFASDRPTNKYDAFIWDNRVALVDALFYSLD